MFTRFADFLRDERGAVTADSFIVISGTGWMLVVLVMDIGTAAVDIGEMISDELEYNEVIHAILDGRGPGTDDWEATH